MRLALRSESLIHRARNAILHAYAVAVAMAMPASAQELRPELTVDAGLTITSNSGYAIRQQQQSDVIASVSPRLRLSRRAGGYSLAGTVGVDALDYLSGTQRDRVLPNGHLELKAELIERWAYVDASSLVQQTSADTFSVLTNEVSTVNKITTATSRISPYVDRELGQVFRVEGRADYVSRRTAGDFVSGTPRRDSLTERYGAKFERRPVPFGASVEYEGEDTDYKGNSIGALSLSTVRASLSYQFDGQLLTAVVLGRDHSELALLEHREVLYGVRLGWQPSERARVAATVERRFFGTGWSLDWTLRSPYYALALQLNRGPATQQTSLGLPAGGGDTAMLVDAMLSTRYPNVGERAALVQSIIANLGLPSELKGSVDILANYAQLWRGARATLAFLGRLTAVTFSAHAERAEELTVNGVSLGSPGTLAGADSKQYGIVMDVSRRLTSAVSMGATLSFTQIDGLGHQAGNFTKNASGRLRLSSAISPRTTGTLGIGLQRSLSSITNEPISDVTAFALLGHRFN